MHESAYLVWKRGKGGSRRDVSQAAIEKRDFDALLTSRCMYGREDTAMKLASLRHGMVICRAGASVLPAHSMGANSTMNIQPTRARGRGSSATSLIVEGSYTVTPNTLKAKPMLLILKGDTC